MFDFDIFVVRCAVLAIGAGAVSKRVGGAALESLQQLAI
jgi:hypothetical protein